MGYFANGTENEIFRAQYCDHCIHDKEQDCRIILLHLMWNYEQFKSHTQKKTNGVQTTKRKALATFINLEKNGEPQTCNMFYAYRHTEQFQVEVAHISDVDRLKKWVGDDDEVERLLVRWGDKIAIEKAGAK